MTTRLTILMLLGFCGNALAVTTETCLADGVLTTWADPSVDTGDTQKTLLSDATIGSTCDTDEPDCDNPLSAIVPPKRPAGPQCLEGGPLCTPDAPGLAQSLRTNLVLVFPELSHPTYRPGTWPTAGLPEHRSHYSDWLSEPTAPPPRT